MASANRISVTPALFSEVRGAVMVPTMFHDFPPFVVPATVVHMESPHGATPSNHPSFGDTQDCDWTRRPVGIADAAGVAPEAAGPMNATVSRAVRHIDASAASVGRRMIRDLQGFGLGTMVRDGSFRDPV
jgi:hypothetical protein